MVANADISQGFSFEKDIGGAKVYEHQLNVKHNIINIVFTNVLKKSIFTL
jgi:hypothetical protein